MELREIIESGLLELYVLNQLDASDRLMVEGYIQRYPELATEIKEIEQGYFAIGQNMAGTVSGDVKDEILRKARMLTNGSGQVRGSSGSAFNVWSILLLTALLGSIFLWYTERQKLTQSNEEYALLQSNCDSLEAVRTAQFAMQQELYSPNNEILAFTATEAYPQTKLYFHTNANDGKNFIQVHGLPPINDDQSYQLWSLKGDDAPRPLNVFQGDDELFEVEFIEGSNAYAITIEQKGGAQSPNLEQLIGIVEVSS